MILCTLALGLSALNGFSPARPWAVGFADAPKIPLVADLSGQNTFDLIAVTPGSDVSIDVNTTVMDMKGSGGTQALDKWGKSCEIATAGTFQGESKATVAGLFGGTSIYLAKDFANGRFQSIRDWAKIPHAIPKPVISLIDEGKT